MKKIYVIGIGPGGPDHMTLRAKKAIEDADVVVGYTPYLGYVKHLTEDKQVISNGMRMEVDRCKATVQMANEGKVVALISTGDSGLYGMASPICQLTEDTDIVVEIVPGVSAAFAAASVVGAPLTHDTALISLSDLLTPLDKILMRVRNAAQGDFVICLYNPKSSKRVEPFLKTCEILREELGDDRICIIVKNALRDSQSIVFTNIAKLALEDVDMNSLVIVGNDSTYVKGERAVTPRGYGL